MKENNANVGFTLDLEDSSITLNHVEKSVRGAYTRFARMCFPVKILLMAFPTRMRMAEMNSCCDRANADDGRLTPSIELF